LVIGATQGTGNQIANLLLRDGYQVRALVRNEAKGKAKLNPAVEIVLGDVTKPDTLPSAIKDADCIIFTAGVTQRPASEPLIIATEYEGVKNTLAAANDAGFSGRFLYMTSIGVRKSSLAATFLNLVKGNTLKWRKLAEDEIRSSGLEYTIIRAGFLMNSLGGRRAIEVSQNDYPLALRYRISRADVAEVFVQVLKHPTTRWTRFEVVWAKAGRRHGWDVLFRQLTPDARDDLKYYRQSNVKPD
jgi:uncharacterized protein YbjT (DUF2867 family)